MRRTGIVICVVAGVLLALPSAASAAPSCTWLGLGEVFIVTADGSAESASLTIERSGANLQARDANGSVIGPCAAEPAEGITVTNTNTIEVIDAAGHDVVVTVSMQGGEFAPGLEPEPVTPEIELLVTLGDGSDTLNIDGSDSADNWVFGESGAGDGGANLNAVESAFDVDLTASGVEGGLFRGRGGTDTITAVGNAAFPEIINPLTLSSLTIEGNNQEDDLRGGSGSDSMLGGTQDDNVRGGAGDDSIDGGDQDDKVDGGVGGDRIEGGEGTDRVLYNDRGTPLTVTVGNGGADDGGGEDQGGAGRDNIGFSVEHVTGGTAGDTIVGSSVRNVLTGGLGDDVFLGGEGNDDLEGEGGNDQLDGEGGNDNVSGGDGDDTGRGSGGSDDLLGDNGGDRLLGGSNADFLRGDKGKDVHKGQSGNDKINARDRKRDRTISCGKGKAKRESAKVDKKDPWAKSC